MIFRYELQGDTYTLSLERSADGTLTAQVGDARYRVTVVSLGSHGYQLTLDGQRHTIYAKADDRQRFVQAVNRPALTLSTADPKPARRRAGGVAGGSSLTAQMPGQVVEAAVAAGDRVKAGQTLIILEAMKMEIRIVAPQDGSIKALHVAKGDVVERDQLLVELDISPGE